LSCTLQVLIILIFSNGLYGQSTVKIEGFVRDKETMQPLLGANVIVEGTGFGSVVNEQGIYIIENIPEGEYRLRASYVGYQSVISDWIQVESDHISRFDFNLTQLLYQIPEVEVFGERIISDLFDATADFEIIGEEEIRRGGYQSVGEVVQEIAGVFIQSTGATNSQQTISIRGSKTSHVMVVIDGVRVSKPHGGAVDLSLIPFSSIQEIAVIKGGNSAQFGADALAGVVYIKTKQFAEKPPRMVLGNIGSFGARSIQGIYGYRLGKWQFFGNYERRISRNDFPYTDPYGKRHYRENADFSMNNIFGKIRFINTRTIIILSGFVNYTNRGLPGFIYDLSSDARSSDTQKIINLMVNREIDKRLQIEWQSSYNGYYDEDKKESFHPYHTENKSFSIENTARLKMQWNNYFTTLMGFSNRIDEGKLKFVPVHIAEPGLRINRISSVNIYNEYNQPLKGLIRSITGVASFGYIYQHHSRGYATQKFGILAKLDMLLSPQIKTNWSRSFRLPDFYDMYYEGYRSMGNPNLRPERGIDFDVGGSLIVPFFGKIEFEGTYFYNTRKDLIHWRQQFDGVFYPVNISRALIFGSEWKLDWKSPRDILSICVNYTYMKALNKSGERTTHNKILTNRPMHMTIINGTLALNPFFCSIKQRFVSRRFIREANSKWIPPYAVTDCIVGGELSAFEKKLRIRFGIYNFFNEEYTIVERAPMHGREIRLSAEILF